MSTVITKNGRIVRSELSPRGGKYLHPDVKKMITRQFHKAVRRDSRNIIREQLEGSVVSAQEEQFHRLRDEALRMEECFWGWDTTDEHERETERLHDRQQEQFEEIRSWKEEHDVWYWKRVEAGLE